MRICVHAMKYFDKRKITIKKRERMTSNRDKYKRMSVYTLSFFKM